ncbi:MAG: hypothetical protein AAB354_14875 [candidate division KSB1 bacterium]
MIEMQELIFEAPTLAGSELEEDKWLREKLAFYRLLPTLLGSLRGKWVAIHNETVFEVGDSFHGVLAVVGERLPKTDIYIQLVDEKMPVVRMSSPRLAWR